MNPDLDAAPCLFGFLFGWSRCLLCGFSVLGCFWGFSEVSNSFFKDFYFGVFSYHACFLLVVLFVWFIFSLFLNGV